MRDLRKAREKLVMKIANVQAAEERLKLKIKQMKLIIKDKEYGKEND